MKSQFLTGIRTSRTLKIRENFDVKTRNKAVIMFKSLGIRCRRHTCKVILLTSLVWCFLDILILLNYSDCSNGVGWGCAGRNSENSGHQINNIPGKRGALQYAHQLSQVSFTSFVNGLLITYRSNKTVKQCMKLILRNPIVARRSEV